MNAENNFRKNVINIHQNTEEEKLKSLRYTNLNNVQNSENINNI